MIKITKIQNLKSQNIKNNHNITSLLNLTNYNKLLYISIDDVREINFVYIHKDLSYKLKFLFIFYYVVIKYYKYVY